MRVAITGATGFVGQYLVDHFSNKNYKVIALGRSLSKLDALFKAKSVKNIETDYSVKHLEKELKGCDALVHLAAKRLQKNIDQLDIEPYISDNILLTGNILKTAKKLNIIRVCQSSTIGVYSNSNKLPFDENQDTIPISIYGVSKSTCENLANLYTAKTNVKVTNLRLASLFGIGEKEGVLFTDYLNLALKKKTLEIWGKGETQIDFLYIKDAVTAIDKSIQLNALGGTFNIGSGMGYSIKEIATNINRVFDNEGNIKILANKQEGGYKVYMNTNKAMNELDWKPNFTLEEALHDMKTIMEIKN